GHHRTAPVEVEGNRGPRRGEAAAGRVAHAPRRGDGRRRGDGALPRGGAAGGAGARAVVHPQGAVLGPGVGPALVAAGAAGGRGGGGRGGPADLRAAVAGRPALAAAAGVPAAGAGRGGDPGRAGRDHDDLHGQPAQPLRAEHRTAGERARGGDRRADGGGRVLVHHRGPDPARGAAGARAVRAGLRLRHLVRGARAGHLRRDRALPGRRRAGGGPLLRRGRGGQDGAVGLAAPLRSDDPAGVGGPLGADSGLHRKAAGAGPGARLPARVPPLQRRAGTGLRVVHRRVVRLRGGDRGSDGRAGAALGKADPGGDPGAVDPVQPGDRVPAADRADRAPADPGDDVRAAGARHRGDPAGGDGPRGGAAAGRQPAGGDVGRPAATGRRRAAGGAR
ncbi:MAG: hypothetical protein AVDCRST_MAG49-1025, partial [uncultured Thermomicrobiales bacterium]